MSVRSELWEVMLKFWPLCPAVPVVAAIVVVPVLHAVGEWGSTHVNPVQEVTALTLAGLKKKEQKTQSHPMLFRRELEPRIRCFKTKKRFIYSGLFLPQTWDTGKWQKFIMVRHVQCPTFFLEGWKRPDKFLEGGQVSKSKTLAQDTKVKALVKYSRHNTKIQFMLKANPRALNPNPSHGPHVKPSLYIKVSLLSSSLSWSLSLGWC